MLVSLPEHKVLVLDFDGVILESVTIKDMVYRDVFPDTSLNERDAILTFHLSTPGIYRRTKVQRIFTEVLNRSCNKKDIEGILSKFRQKVWERLMVCEEVACVREYLERNMNVPKYVVSASPQEELSALVDARGFSKYFQNVLGSPKNKLQHISNIIEIESVSPNDVLYIGDKISDMVAARASGVQFVGRLTEVNPTPFPDELQVLNSFCEM